MALHRHLLDLNTQKSIEVIDITASVRDFVKTIRLKEGFLHLASQHTTMGLVVNERCESLQKDLVDFLGRLAPPRASYRHDEVAGDGRPNTHSHLLAHLIPSQVTLVVSGGEPELGSWQSIFAIELDGPRRSRKIHLTALGNWGD